MEPVLAQERQDFGQDAISALPSPCSGMGPTEDGSSARYAYVEFDTALPKPSIHANTHYTLSGAS